jgi:hypothetical protein
VLLRGAAPFEQQAQCGGIDIGDRGEIDHEIAVTELPFAGLAQRRGIGDGERFGGFIDDGATGRPRRRWGWRR